MTTYRLSANEIVTVVARTVSCLQVHAQYAPGGRPPPTHRHPSQIERFQIVSGALRVVVDGEVHDVRAGQEIIIPAGTPHRMWNYGSELALVEWFTEPAGRTEEWFAVVSDLGGPDGRRRDLIGLLAGLSEYGDVFRLDARPRWLVAIAVSIAGQVARRIVARRPTGR